MGLGARIRQRIHLSMKHAVSLITARLSFAGTGAQASEPILTGGDQFYMEDGKLYRTRTHKEVPPKNHSVTEARRAWCCNVM